MGALRLYICFVDKLSEWIGRAMSVLVMSMTLVLTYEVISRYIFNRPTIWAYDTAIFMFGYCGLLSGAYVLKSKGHINVDILYCRLSNRRKAIMDVINGLLFFLFIIMIIVYTWKPAISALVANEHGHSEWAPPVGHFKLMIPIGAFLLLLQGFADWIRSLYRAITDKELKV